MFKNDKIKITDFKLKSKSPSFKAQALSGKFQRRFSGIQYYEAEFTAKFAIDDISHVKNFLARHRFGRPFRIPLYYFTQYTGNVTGMVTASAPASRGARKVSLSNFGGTLRAGTTIQFENHSKLYEVTEDCTGSGELKLFPNLYQNVTAGEVIKYRNAEGEFILTNDDDTYDLTQISQLKIKVTENV
ncbi:hypothetical protein [Edwardsiella tarda]|uniref:Phage protein n=1 Tax=Edwardsiella tarda TaxID=636 RepID=A0A2A7U7M8_EDWTA|nr:hypothetical protein [Edwardsiella tarda]PEH74294.1 hypothetical protein CRM76_01235 [Edwardsiella tarda]